MQAWDAWDRDTRIGWVHKLKGTAGNLQLKRLAAQAAEVERELHGVERSPGREEPVGGLRAAMATTLTAIASYLELEAGPGWVQTEIVAPAVLSGGPAEATDLLVRAIGAIRLCSPADVEPMLAELEHAFTPERLARLRAALASFDFEQAETAARQIGAEFGLALPPEQAQGAPT